MTYTVVAPLAYQGKADCESVLCRFPGTPGCLGWHCSYCDQPCSSQGHGCDASKTLIAEAIRQSEKGDSPS